MLSQCQDTANDASANDDGVVDAEFEEVDDNDDDKKSANS